MKTLIFILILLSFLQTTIVSLDLVLLSLLLRAYILVDRSNLNLAFSFGLLVSFLGHLPLGFESIVFLTLVQSVHLFSKSPISKNIFAVVPIILILLFIHELMITLYLHQSIIIWPKFAVEGLIILPIYMVIKFWEDRFVVRSEIKLKV